MGKIKLIYNPKAGAKKSIFSWRKPPLMLDTINDLFRKYEIEYDEAPTKGPGDARVLAAAAAAEGYDTVVVAGGDGTVGEAANGLVGTVTALGILPLGTFMNVARMLSIPFLLEQAVMMIKMRNIRTIDVGEITMLEGERVSEPTYFLEAAGIGVEAEFQQEFLQWERGDWSAIIRIFQILGRFYSRPVKVELDQNRSFNSTAHIIMVQNGPYADAALPLAPTAKLNDHVLTVKRFRMSKLEILRHLLRIRVAGGTRDPKIETYKTTTVRISSGTPRPVHADARVFGHTPIGMRIRPSALKVITGFPDSPEDSALIKKRTYISP